MSRKHLTHTHTHFWLVGQSWPRTRLGQRVLSKSRDRSMAQNHNSGHLRMFLDVPDVYLIERAPRCLCHASPRPRPADGANGAMHTLGGHMQMKVKQGHSGTRRDVICWQLPPEGWRRLPQYYLRPILNGAADVLPTWCYTDRGGEVNARGVRPLANKYGMRHITSCASARRVGWCRAAQCGDDSAKLAIHS